MDTLQWAAEQDEDKAELSKAQRTRILDRHQTRDVYNETEEMGWVELYRWLGY